MFIFPYKAGSMSAKSLSESLPAKRIKLKGSKFKPNARKVVINWGSSAMPAAYAGCKVLNKPENVALAANKLRAFVAMSEAGVNVPVFTTSSDEVDTGGREGAVTWVVRHKLSGHSGQGIELLHAGDDVPQAPLYVKYVKKKDEWRVHVFGDDVVDVQRKARNRDVADEDVNWAVRNHGNGFIFARNEDRDVPEDVTAQSVAAVAALGLDFGAVDVIYNEREGKAYVLEVNTAPGLTGSTLDGYTERFKSL